MNEQRRRFLCSSASVATAAAIGVAPGELLAADVSWLRDVQTPPKVDLARARERIGELAPLLVADGKQISNQQAWAKQRARILKQWQSFLGPMPPHKPPVKFKILKTDFGTGFTRQIIRYETEPGVTNEAYLLAPDSKKRKLPALVALHQTSKQHIHEIAGVAGPRAQHLGPQLCRQGFIVVCPKNFLWHEVDKYIDAVHQHRKRHPKTLGMHKMLHDAVRAVDVALSLPRVDKQRIGCLGHSLGAKEVLYLMAFDRRVRAGVASEGGLTFRSTNWDAPWYLGKEIYKPGFALNHHQLLALIAPRPLLVLGGEKGRGAADGSFSWPLIEAALPVYKLYGKPARLGIYTHGRGHSIPPKARQYMQEWLRTYV